MDQYKINIFKQTFFITVFVICTLFASTKIVEAQEERPKDSVFYIEVLNKGMPTPTEEPNLETPQAALEHFILSAQEGDYEAAAQALNLNRIPPEEQQQRAAELAERLHYVISKQIILDWEGLPDRPDGQIDFGTNQTNPLIGVPRRSFRLGSINLDGRDIAIRIDRVQVGDERPVWVISDNTVENIDALYEEYGPTLFDQWLPEWTKEAGWGDVLLWEWFVIIGLITLSVIVARTSYQHVPRLINHFMKDSQHLWLRNIGSSVPAPMAFLTGLLTFYIPTEWILSLTGPFASWLQPIFFILLITGLTWLGMRLIHYVSDCWGETYRELLQEEDSLHARKMLTYISVTRRALIFIAVLIGIGIIFNQFDSLQVFGISVLASAGVVSVILGIAAQHVLGNILVGIQIGLAQPVRIGDNVHFEGEWGWIESIAYTFLTIRIWDGRRLVVPLTYFSKHPIENWSVNDPFTIRPIYLYVDHQTNVQMVREKFFELVDELSDKSDKAEPELWVTDFKEDVLELRATCGADDPTDAWDLHVQLREALTTWLQELDDGLYLPRQRLQIEDRPKSLNGKPIKEKGDLAPETAG